MADCLTLLRQYNTQKKEIVERDSLVIFDKIAWPKNARTNYLIYRYRPLVCINSRYLQPCFHLDLGKRVELRNITH